MDVIFDWNLGNMIYNGLITLRLCGFPFTEIRSLHRVCGVATTVYRREQDSRRFGWKLDSEDGGERSGRGFALRGLTGDPLARGEGLELSPELPDRKLDPPLWHHGPFMLYPNCSNRTLSFIITQARSYINTIY